MSAHCDHHAPQTEKIVNLSRYRQILWIALVVNFTMFLVEIGAGVQAGSLSLLADAVDFAGDALNYAVSLAVLASALAWRARAAVFKAATMIGFGLYVLGSAVWSVWNGELPQAVTMGAVALLALAANVAKMAVPPTLNPSASPVKAPATAKPWTQRPETCKGNREMGRVTDISGQAFDQLFPSVLK